MPDKKIELEVAEGMVAVLKSAVAPVQDEDAKLARVTAIAKELDEQGQNKVRMALRLLSGIEGMPEGAMKALASAAGIEYGEPGMSKSEHEAAVKKAVDAALEKAKQPGARIIKTADGTEIDLSKIPEDQRAPFEALVKHADTQSAEVNTLKAENARRDALAKAATDYPHLDAGKVATLVQKTAALGGDVVKTLGEVLKQAEELIKAGGTGELGAGGEKGAGGEAYAKIEALADQLVKKSEGKMSRQKAIDEVLKTEDGKRLYEEYRAEQDTKK